MNKQRSTFDELYEKYSLLIYKHALYKLHGDAYAAEDVAADVFFTLHQKLDSMEITPKIYGWLVHTADNYVKKYFTAQARRQRHEQNFDETTELIPAPESLEQNVIERADATDEDIEKMLGRLYERLADDEKRIFELRYVKKLTLTDAAKASSMPYSSFYYKAKELDSRIRKIAAEISSE